MEFSFMMVLVVLGLFASGVSQPIIMEYIKYAGLGDKFGLVYMIPNYIFMPLFYFYPWKWLPEEESQKRFHKSDMPKSQQVFRILGLSFLDFFSYTIITLGMFLCGSALYTIIYASVTVFTAVETRLFFRTRLSLYQWISVIIVSGGLALNGFALSDAGSNVLVGGIVVFIGTVGHSLVYIVNEHLIARSSLKIPSVRLSAHVGAWSCLMLALWLGVYTAPRWHSAISHPVEKADSSFGYIIFLFALKGIVDFIHTGCFYFSLGQIGAIATGVIKGATAVSVFIASAVFFCSREDSQCFTPLKGGSLAMVVCGVVLYSWAKGKKKAPRRQADTVNAVVVSRSETSPLLVDSN
eukprot:GCRY01003334.1.p1 GENE.GCRY01003334.1~~GCRY01003334.1.p1  ORF type:complete len:352 (-),score=42.37 GCRY01003334.1:245-1300(-)